MGFDYQIHRFDPTGKIHLNKRIEELAELAISKGIAKKSKSGALVVNTGKYTGRSPQDRYIVDSPKIRSKINWGKVNILLKNEKYQRLLEKITNHLNQSGDIFVYDGIAGADKKYQIHVRIISEFAHQALFANHIFREPEEGELDQHQPDLTVLVAPNCLADPKTDGTNSEVFIALNPEEKMVLIGGSHYSGEIKKSVFSYLNFILPDTGVLPMHCSANVGKDNKSALFFGLSGTGKTTLSADPERLLVGDDEHGWSENGIFNFEGGCYAKCINLNRESEPQIFDAIKDYTVVENVVLDKDNNLVFADASISENTRAAYPLSYINNAVAIGVAGHPQKIIFLTADAFGVLPAVAKLDTNAAMYHFLSGYTSKLAGAERGVVQPEATFSECFGAPFMPLKPLVYAKLLKKYLTKYKSQVYLVNTGWFGGPYGIGSRMNIKATRHIVSSILNGELDKVKYQKNPHFNLDVPNSIPELDDFELNPRASWKDKKAYDKKAKGLAKLFVDNMKKFGSIPKAIINQGPKI